MIGAGIFGKYIHESFPSHYLELRSDGTYLLFEGSSSVTGSYEINGAEITIFASGSTSKANLQGGVITDADGDRWTFGGAIPDAPPPPAPRTITAAQQSSTRSMTDDVPLDSITWLPAFLKQELPWELFEAIAAAVVLIIVSIAATHS